MSAEYLHAFFRRHEREHGFHQRGFARRARALHDDGERRVELARDGREIADELVRLLADDAARGKVREDPVEQLRIAQQRERGGALARRVMLGAAGFGSVCARKRASCSSSSLSSTRPRSRLMQLPASARFRSRPRR